MTKIRVCSVCEREIINSNGMAANSTTKPCDNCRPRPGGLIRVKYLNWGSESKGFVQPFNLETWKKEGKKWIEKYSKILSQRRNKPT